MWVALRVLHFRDVNKADSPCFQEGMDRHHILPRQLLNNRQIDRFLNDLRYSGFFIDDFASNGVLLPALPGLSERLRLPLHRGGHRRYNGQVIALVDAIRRANSGFIPVKGRAAFATACLRKLQNRLKRSILTHGADDVDTIMLYGLDDDHIERAAEAFAARCRDRPQKKCGPATALSFSINA